MLDSLVLSPSQRSFLQEAAETYHATVAAAAPYLVARGLGKETAASFLLGSVSDPLPGHERFRGMLSIPYLSPAGVLGFKFRCTQDHDCKSVDRHAKYDSPSGQKARLFNVAALHAKSDTVVIVEGELSAMVCTDVVGVPAVGTPGTQWVKEHPHWARCFADFERVLVVADNDLPGAKGEGPGVAHAKKVASTIQGAQVVYPPAGMDLDEWVLAEGVDAVRKGMGL